MEKEEELELKTRANGDTASARNMSDRALYISDPQRTSTNGKIGEREKIRSGGDMPVSEGGEACLTGTQLESSIKKTRGDRQKTAPKVVVKNGCYRHTHTQKQHEEFYEKRVQTDGTRTRTGADKLPSRRHYNYRAAWHNSISIIALIAQ